MSNITIGKLLAFLGSLITGYIMPAKDFLSIITILIFVDSFFKVLEIYLKRCNDKFSLRKLIFKGILIKVIVYYTAIILTYKLHLIFILPTLHTSNVVIVIMFIIMWNEIYSCYKHFMKITGRNIKKDLTTLDRFVNYVRKILDKMQGK